MTIEAKIIADSISPDGIRLTTMQLRYPRFIHAEFMTHRVFSRNASSSRAIPVERMIADLRRDPAMPVFWGSNKPGMQAGAELDDEAIRQSKMLWLSQMEDSISTAESLIEQGLHKQIANRILEPWAHINVVVTATEWDNFYELRRHPDAQPEIHALADAMWGVQQASTPARLHPGQWHLPYVSAEEVAEFGEVAAISFSVARCARVSYLTHDGKEPNPADDRKLYERLVLSTPLHASPAEHQATPDQPTVSFKADKKMKRWGSPKEHGNFVGWRQYRKQLEKLV